MKKYILIFLATAILVLFSCKKKEKEPDACCKKPAGTEESAGYDESVTLHDITSDWTTQDNGKMQLKYIKGKVVVMAMIFTNCKAACPRITADLQRIEEAIPKDKLNEVSFILLSMDPERDTPEQLKKFAADYELDLSRWTLLTGSDSDVLEISGVLNVRIKKMTDGSFDHSNIIHILNDKGNIVHQQVGLAIDPAESIDKINALL